MIRSIRFAMLGVAVAAGAVALSPVTAFAGEGKAETCESCKKDHASCKDKNCKKDHKCSSCEGKAEGAKAEGAAKTEHSH